MVKVEEFNLFKGFGSNVDENIVGEVYVDVYEVVYIDELLLYLKLKKGDVILFDLW